MMNSVCTKIPTKMAAGAVVAITRRAFQTSTPSICSGGGLDVTFKTNAKPTLFTSYELMNTNAKTTSSFEAKATLEQNTTCHPTALLRQKLALKGFENIFQVPETVVNSKRGQHDDSNSCTNCHKCPHAGNCPMAQITVG